MKRLSGLLLLVLLVSSCVVSYENLSIEVMKPAKFTLPSTIRKVALVSRNLKYTTDTLQNYQEKNLKLIKDKVRLNIDSVKLKVCLDSLATNMLALGQFDSVLVYPVTAFPVIRVQKIGPGNAEWYNRLANETNADGLIILDMFSSFYKNSERINSTPTTSVITSNIWSVFDCKRRKIIDRFAQVDTLFWDGIDANGDFSRNRLPEKKEAMILAAGKTGKNYVGHILPSWTLVYRDIMTCDRPELKQAAKLAQKGNWDEAASLWQKNIQSEHKLDRIISLYNMALTSEMNGDVDHAIELTDLAAKASSGAFWSGENEAVRKYSAILYQRKTDINKLSLQHEQN